MECVRVNGRATGARPPGGCRTVICPRSPLWERAPLPTAHPITHHPHSPSPGQGHRCGARSEESNHSGPAPRGIPSAGTLAERTWPRDGSHPPPSPSPPSDFCSSQAGPAGHTASRECALGPVSLGAPSPADAVPAVDPSLWPGRRVPTALARTGSGSPAGTSGSVRALWSAIAALAQWLKKPRSREAESPTHGHTGRQTSWDPDSDPVPHRATQSLVLD